MKKQDENNILEIGKRRKNGETGWYQRKIEARRGANKRKKHNGEGVRMVKKICKNAGGGKGNDKMAKEESILGLKNRK